MARRSEKHKIGYYANQLSRFSEYREEDGKSKVPKVVRRLVIQDLKERADRDGMVAEEDFSRAVVEKLPTMEHDFYDWRVDKNESEVTSARSDDEEFDNL